MKSCDRGQDLGWEGSVDEAPGAVGLPRGKERGRGGPRLAFPGLAFPAQPASSRAVPAMPTPAASRSPHASCVSHCQPFVDAAAPSWIAFRRHSALSTHPSQLRAAITQLTSWILINWTPILWPRQSQTFEHWENS